MVESWKLLSKFPSEGWLLINRLLIKNKFNVSEEQLYAENLFAEHLEKCLWKS